ncbi:microsomal dipeptidase-like Zn-dependent dipeptidase [Litorimonas taeanensis]|uniref:Microsomal dipeptidase-like Zn-dependent dipeptidase n=1 Tax=Litorimonas taeanensis TaxID=568099 RepID=A0A420WDQ9_9PROT|nr:membrane dipeptidase [Litorimonas taeanensis]RKQ69159.1 microsomal dipeptidase-like Zn-dependent dipeptidase [Litorimonas taeanensis]
MKTFLKSCAWLILVGVIIGGFYVFAILVPKVDKDLNQVTAHAPYPVSETAQTLHDSLLITDLHADNLLWRRNPEKRNNYGQVDFPRLREGGVNIQVFSAVTKSPRGLNFDENDAGAPDDIALLAKAQLWPVRTWGSIYERAAFQAQRLHRLASHKENKLVIAKSKSDLDQADDVLIGLLLTEGAHPLEGKIENISRLYNEGYRAMGLQHFFDNALGGSMHGRSQSGLTEFGKAAVKEMERQNIMIDVAHSSVASVRDTLAITNRPIFISHGGTISHCPQTANRNLPDDILIEIASRGGIIGIGYFNGVVCDISPKGIAAAIIHAVNLLGPDAVALGSDFDGSVTTAFDTSELAALTHELLEQGLDALTIRKVMGENAKIYFTNNLPD